MPWTGKVILDPDKSDVGTATATWNEGLPDEFTYSRRAKLTVAERNAFVAEAKAALSVRDTQGTKETSLSANLTTALNA